MLGYPRKFFRDFSGATRSQLASRYRAA